MAQSEPDSNPYSTPESPESNQTRLDFVPVIRRWERLRIIYNLVLLSIVMMVTTIWFPDRAFDATYWLPICVAGAIANLCFMTGPAIEGYGRYFRVWHPVMTVLLFLAGLVFSIYLTIGVLAGITGTF